jgi:hypothetical protein
MRPMTAPGPALMTIERSRVVARWRNHFAKGGLAGDGLQRHGFAPAARGVRLDSSNGPHSREEAIPRDALSHVDAGQGIARIYGLSRCEVYTEEKYIYQGWR